MFRHRLLPLAGVFLVACGGGQSSPATVPPTSAAPTSIVTVPPESTVTTAMGSTTTGVDPLPVTTAPGTIGLSPDGPWTLVDSAPGIATPGLVYELMPKLWVYLPVEEDLSHGITWTLTELDRPIIEAYLQARLVYFQATTARPMDLEAPGWAEWYADSGQVYLNLLEPRRVAGEAVEMDAGVVLRPSVLGDGRSEREAIVFDCVLDGSVFRRADGELADGSTPGVAPHGIGYRLQAASGTWRVTQVGEQPDACV